MKFDNTKCVGLLRNVVRGNSSNSTGALNFVFVHSSEFPQKHTLNTLGNIKQGYWHPNIMGL